MEKKEKVWGGGWQSVGEREGMRKLFNSLKEKGSFGSYSSYEEWEKAVYPEEEKTTQNLYF